MEPDGRDTDRIESDKEIGKHNIDVDGTETQEFGEHMEEVSNTPSNYSKEENLEYWNQEMFWGSLSLLAEGGENLVKGSERSLKALSLYTILQLAIDLALTEVLKLCFRLGINVNGELRCGKTPLMLCIDADNADMIKALIECGVDINQKAKNIDSPLHYAIEYGKNNAAEALIKYGKEKLLINSLGNDGLAPMHRAAKLNRQELIYTMARFGADVNIKGEGGATPLHITAACNECIRPRVAADEERDNVNEPALKIKCVKI